MQRLLIALPAALVLALALTFSACGGDDDDAGSSATATAAPSENGDGTGDQDAEDSPTGEATSTDDDDEPGDGNVQETPVSASGQNACELISADEINDITDGGFREGEQTIDGCAFPTPGGDTINVVLQRFPGQAEQKFDSFVGLDLLGFEEIGGAGERAAWSDDSNELLILTGDNIVSVIIFYTSSDDNDVERDQAFAIAEIVLGRLG